MEKIRAFNFFKTWSYSKFIILELITGNTNAVNKMTSFISTAQTSPGAVLLWFVYTWLFLVYYFNLRRVRICNSKYSSFHIGFLEIYVETSLCIRRFIVILCRWRWRQAPGIHKDNIACIPSIYLQPSNSVGKYKYKGTKITNYCESHE